MCTIRFYSKEEDTVILECISKNAGNLSKGYKEAAELLGRTPKAIEFHFNKKLRTSSVAFMTIGVNRKNFNSDSASPSNPHVQALIAECEKKIEVLKDTIAKLRTLEL